MSEVRSFAYIIDTSMKKMANRSMNLDENISNILDMQGKYQLCDELYHEGKRTTIDSIMSA